MADRRVRVPKDKETLIVKLTRTDDANGGAFQTRADLMTFAAVLGYSEGTKVPFGDWLEPIRQEVFARSGHDTVINLLALATTHDPKCLAHNDEAEDLRISIFEEYANGGLEFLRSELQGIDDPLEHLLLLIDQQRKNDKKPGEFDLSDFLG